jgi:hypothetical protein
MFVRYPRHRLRSVPSAAICATGLDPDHGFSSEPPAAIRAMGRDLRGDSQENETKYIIAMTKNSSEKRPKLKE